MGKNFAINNLIRVMNQFFPIIHHIPIYLIITKALPQMGLQNRSPLSFPFNSMHAFLKLGSSIIKHPLFVLDAYLITYIMINCVLKSKKSPLFYELARVNILPRFYCYKLFILNIKFLA